MMKKDIKKQVNKFRYKQVGNFYCLWNLETGQVSYNGFVLEDEFYFV